MTDNTRPPLADRQPLPHLPSDHPPVHYGRVGVLLTNLGTPDAPDVKSVRRYLKEFLSDPRVVEIPQIIWQPLLRGVILNVRPRKSAHAYQQIWQEGGSPLAVYSAQQAADLQRRLGGIPVSHAMRYGSPSIADQLARMRDQGCDRILIAPLYPQYCGATTATANDAAFAAIAQMRWQPAVRTLPPYHDNPVYIAALAQSVRVAVGAMDQRPDHLLVSFHGMPFRTLTLGDPYHCQCQKTARLLADAIDMPVSISFQSRFGNARWLEPATDTELARLAQAGVRNMAIIAPGFSVDCLETLEELAIRGKEEFVAAGGEGFAYIPCLNASDAGMDMLEHLVRTELSGWLQVE